MTKLIDKETVAKAISELTAAGKKPTLQAIRAACGNIGSMGTIIKLKAELDSERSTTNASSSCTTAFREMWAQAVEEGRAQRSEELDDLRQAIDALSADLSAAEGEAAGARAKVEEIESQRNGLIQQVATAHAAATEARAAGEQNALKLAETLEQLSKLQSAFATERAALSKAAHTAEIALARLEGKHSATAAAAHSAKPKKPTAKPVK